MINQIDKLQKKAKKRIDALEYSNQCCDKYYGKISRESSPKIRVINVLSKRIQRVLDENLKKSMNQELSALILKTKNLLELLLIYLDARITLRKIICLVNLFYAKGFYKIIIRNIKIKSISYKSNKINKLCKLYNDLLKKLQNQEEYEALFKKEYLELTQSIEKEDRLVRQLIRIDIFKIENIND